MDMQPMQPVYMYVCIYMSWKCVCILCCCVDCVPAAAAIYIYIAERFAYIRVSNIDPLAVGADLKIIQH